MSGRRTDIFQPKKEPPDPPNFAEVFDSVDAQSHPTPSVSEQRETLPQQGSTTPPSPVTPTPTAVNPEKPVPTEAPASTSSDFAENTVRTSGEQKTEDKRQPTQDEPSPRRTQTPPSPPTEDTGPLCRLCGTRKNRSTRLCRYCDVPRYLEDAEAQDLYMLMSGKKLQVRKKPSQTRTKTSRGWSSKSPRRKSDDDYIRQMERDISEANLVALTIKVLAISLIGALIVLGLWNYERVVAFLEDATDRLFPGTVTVTAPPEEETPAVTRLQPYTLQFSEIRRGYCLNRLSEEDEEWIDLTRVDCDDLHELEVFYRGRGLSANPDEVGTEQVFEECDRGFEAFVGVAKEDSHFTYSANWSSWETDRNLVCLLHTEDFRKVRGSAEARSVEKEPSRLLPQVFVEESGPYELIRSQNTGQTFFFDPCRPVYWVVNPANEPPGARELLFSAFDEISKRTGLLFIYSGETDETYTWKRDARNDRYTDVDFPWRPVLVSYLYADEFAEVQRSFRNYDSARQAAGFAGARAVKERGTGSRLVSVTGEVTMEAGWSRYILEAGFPKELWWVFVHEIGHLVGLDHVSDPNHLMYEGNNGYRSEFGGGDLQGFALVGSSSCLPESRYPNQSDWVPSR